MNLLHMYYTVQCGVFIKAIVTSLTEMTGLLVLAWRHQKTDIVVIPVVELQCRGTKLKSFFFVKVAFAGLRVC